MSASRVNPEIKFLLKVSAILVILVLSMINIKNILSTKDVLGVKTEESSTETLETFWQNFMSENPNYIPGWLELNNKEKAVEIDPNFEYLNK